MSAEPVEPEAAEDEALAGIRAAMTGLVRLTITPLLFGVGVGVNVERSNGYTPSGAPKWAKAGPMLVTGEDQTLAELLTLLAEMREASA